MWKFGIAGISYMWCSYKFSDTPEDALLNANFMVIIGHLHQFISLILWEWNAGMWSF